MTARLLLCRAAFVTVALTRGPDSSPGSWLGREGLGQEGERCWSPAHAVDEDPHCSVRAVPLFRKLVLPQGTAGMCFSSGQGQ